jgi:hypothetical protein
MGLEPFDSARVEPGSDGAAAVAVGLERPRADCRSMRQQKITSKNMILWKKVNLVYVPFVQHPCKNGL